MNFQHVLLSARLAHGDLLATDTALEGDIEDHAIRHIFMKHLMVSAANVTDLELVVRSLYKDHPELAEIYRPHQKGFDFIKYLRNIFVGHLNPALCDQAMIWQPVLNATITKNAPGENLFLSYMLLETAINTYVDQHDKHKIFASETDLNYPPDMVRFLNFLGETVHAGIRFTEAVGAIALSHLELPDFNQNMLDLSAKAGNLDFSYVTKK